MKTRFLFICLTSIGLLTACGGDDKGGGDSDKDGGGKAAVNCSEKNEVSVTSTSHDLTGVTFDKVSAFGSGWSQSGGKHKRAIYVVFSNHDIEYSSWNVKLSEDPGHFQLHIIVNGNRTENTEGILPLETGTYPFGSSFDETQSFQVSLYQGNQPNNDFFTNNMKCTGTAEITHVDDTHICGSFEATNEGNTVKGSFSVPLEKDFWEDQLQ